MRDGWKNIMKIQKHCPMTRHWLPLYLSLSVCLFALFSIQAHRWNRFINPINLKLVFLSVLVPLSPSSVYILSKLEQEKHVSHNCFMQFIYKMCITLDGANSFSPLIVCVYSVHLNIKLLLIFMRSKWRKNTSLHLHSKTNESIFFIHVFVAVPCKASSKWKFSDFFEYKAVPLIFFYC